MKKKTYYFGMTTIVFLLLAAMAVPALAQVNPTPRLRYAQAANGVTGNQVYVTTLMVTNINNFAVPAVIDSFDHNNPSNPIGLGFTTNCNVNGTTSVFTIPANAACMFTSSGLGPLKTGWLRVTENPQPNGTAGADSIGGYLAFTLWQGNQFTGFPIFTVGVAPTPIYSQFSIPVVRDFASNTDTGFAMINPFASGGPITMTAQLVDFSGTVIEQHTISLNELSHMSLFLSQFFTSLATANGFVGNMFVTAAVSGDGAVTTALLQQSGQFGGAPPTTMVVLANKTALNQNAREDGGLLRQHEKITQSALAPKF